MQRLELYYTIKRRDWNLVVCTAGNSGSDSYLVPIRLRICASSSWLAENHKLWKIRLMLLSSLATAVNMEDCAGQRFCQAAWLSSLR